MLIRKLDLMLSRIRECFRLMARLILLYLILLTRMSVKNRIWREIMGIIQRKRL